MLHQGLSFRQMCPPPPPNSGNSSSGQPKFHVLERNSPFIYLFSKSNFYTGGSAFTIVAPPNPYIIYCTMGRVCTLHELSRSDYHKVSIFEAIYYPTFTIERTELILNVVPLNPLTLLSTRMTIRLMKFQLHDIIDSEIQSSPLVVSP